MPARLAGVRHSEIDASLVTRFFVTALNVAAFCAGFGINGLPRRWWPTAGWRGATSARYSSREPKNSRPDGTCANEKEWGMFNIQEGEIFFRGVLVMRRADNVWPSLWAEVATTLTAIGTDESE